MRENCKPFTPAEDDFLIKHNSTMTVVEMARRLGRSCSSLHSRRKALARRGRLDLDQRAYARPWAELEDQALHDKYGRVSDKALAKSLGRSIGAVRQRALKIGVTRTSGFYTASAASRIFGMSIGAMQGWIEKGWIKAERSRVVGCGSRMVWQIAHEDVERCIKENPHLCDLKRMRFPGNEFFFNLARESKRQVEGDKRRPVIRYWTAQEDAFIINNRHKMSQAQLGERIGRTKEAVHARLVLLKQQGRFLPFKAQWQTRQRNKTVDQPWQWTEEEDQYLRDNWGRERRPDEPGRGKRITASEIARNLGKTVYAVWSRASRLGIRNVGWKRPQQPEEQWDKGSQAWRKPDPAPPTPARPKYDPWAPAVYEGGGRLILGGRR